jgi:hypothetical protein
MTYLIIAFILLLVFAYYATAIDARLGMYDLAKTFVIGFLACAFWPLAIIGMAIGGLMYYLMRVGAKRRGED